jgi:hypothetical protein
MMLLLVFITIMQVCQFVKPGTIFFSKSVWMLILKVNFLDIGKKLSRIRIQLRDSNLLAIRFHTICHISRLSLFRERLAESLLVDGYCYKAGGCVRYYLL